jgi:hypothetical protein
MLSIFVVGILSIIAAAALESGVVVEYDNKSDSAIFESPIKVDCELKLILTFSM